MRIYYVPRKTYKTIGAILLLVIVFLVGFAFIKNQSLFIASRVYSPHYQGATGEKVVALTFNVDWGEEYLPDLLRIMNESDVKSTFFLTGRWAEKHEEMATEIIKSGHEIGNHGYGHQHVKNLAVEQIEKEITDGELSIFKAAGKKPVLYAPAFGEFDKEVGEAAANKKQEVIMWSLDTIDWQNPPSSTIVTRVVPRIHNDAIVLMHPTRNTVEALPEIIKSLKKEGYRFDTVSNIIRKPTKAPARDLHGA